MIKVYDLYLWTFQIILFKWKRKSHTIKLLRAKNHPKVYLQQKEHHYPWVRKPTHPKTNVKKTSKKCLKMKKFWSSGRKSKFTFSIPLSLNITRISFVTWFLSTYILFVDCWLTQLKNIYENLTLVLWVSGWHHQRCRPTTPWKYQNGTHDCP